MDDHLQLAPGKSSGGEASQDNQRDGERGSLSKALSLYSAYSWRGRIGLIAPSTNTTLEPEFARMAPEGVGVYVSRVYQAGRQEPSSYQRMADDIGTASTLLATAEIDVIAFGCTSCTYFVSPETIKATMREKAGCRPILTADAVVDALRAMKLRRIAIRGFSRSGLGSPPRPSGPHDGTSLGPRRTAAVAPHLPADREQIFERTCSVVRE